MATEERLESLEAWRDSVEERLTALGQRATPLGAVGVPAGTVLQPSGPITVTHPNTVIDGLDITGRVLIRAANVVIRNCRINGQSEPYGVRVESGSVLIHDSEIRGFDNGIAFDNWTGLRLDINHATQDGVKMGNNSRLEDSWLHTFTPEAGAHADGIQVQSAVSNVTIRGNRIDVGRGTGRNAAVFIKPELGANLVGSGLLVEGNDLSGGHYTLYAMQTTRRIDGIVIRGNRFSGDHDYGTHSVRTPVTWEFNTVAGDPLPLGG